MQLLAELRLLPTTQSDPLLPVELKRTFAEFAVTVKNSRGAQNPPLLGHVNVTPRRAAYAPD